MNHHPTRATPVATGPAVPEGIQISAPPTVLDVDTTGFALDLTDHEGVEAVPVEPTETGGYLEPHGTDRLSILAMDASEDQRRIYGAILAERDYEITTVASLGELADALAAEDPDVIILEPEGQAAVVQRVLSILGDRALPDDGGRPRPLLLAVTAWVDRASRLSVLGAGVDRWLAKPVMVDELTGAIEELVRSSPGARGGTRTEAARVLVVDDDEAVREWVAETLREEGYTVRTATNGQEGIAKAVAWGPALILMDLVMPELDGWNARRLLARGRFTAEIPVILATESCAEGERGRVREEGFVALLRKPFTSEKLLEVVERALGGANVVR